MPPEDEASTNVQRRVRTGTNTKAPSSLQKRMQRQLAGIMAHLEAHPNDTLSKARVSRITEILKGG